MLQQPYLWLVEHLNYLSNQSVASWPALWAGPGNLWKMLLLEQWTVSAEYQITELIAYNMPQHQKFARGK